MGAEEWTIMQGASGSSTAQTPQGESVAKPETPLLIIVSVACKYKAHGNLFSPLFEKQKSVDKNILGRWLKIKTASQT